MRRPAWSPGSSGTVLETERLRLRWITLEDAALFVEMLNDPGYLGHIGGRGVRTADEARVYIRERVLNSYADHGYSMWLVERRSDGEALGMTGLVRRPFLDGPDLGYALLPRGRGRGVATEAALAVRDLSRDGFGHERLLAITALDNPPSVRVLEKLGFSEVGTTRFDGDGEEVRLFELVFC